MSANWVKLANDVRGHPKLIHAGDRSAWLYVCGLCYSNEYLTDGFIAKRSLSSVAPGVTRPEKLAARLVEAGLWHVVDGGWGIHEYLERQQSAETIRVARLKDSARKQRGIRSESRAASKWNPHGFRALEGEGEGKKEKEEAVPETSQRDSEFLAQDKRGGRAQRGTE